MRLLFLTQTYPRYEGDTCGPFVREIALGLVRAGHRVTVLTPHAPGVRTRWDDAGVRVESFRYAPERFELLGYSRSLQADETMKIGALLATPAYLLAARRAVARELRRESYDLVQAHWIVPNGLPLVFSKRMRRGARLAVGLHGSDVFVAEKPIVRSVVGRVLRHVDVLTGCSGELVQRVCRLGLPSERAYVIPYGVDATAFSPDRSRRATWRQRLGIPSESLVILGVGRMATKKGFHVLTPQLPQLLDRHRDAHVILAGGGDLEPRLKRDTAGFGERVHFPGLVERDVLADLYRAADVFVLPAVHDAKGNVDGLPNVILEAMATGLAVVSTPISGIPLAIEDGVTGLFAPEGDGDALAEALSSILEDEELRRRLGAEARRKVEAELTWDKVAQRYAEAYCSDGASSERTEREGGR